MFSVCFFIEEEEKEEEEENIQKRNTQETRLWGNERLKVDFRFVCCSVERTLEFSAVVVLLVGGVDVVFVSVN